MIELLPQIEQWIKADKPFVITTVIKTWGSSPRPVGSAMIVNQDMEMAGSVSGGCVEGSVIKTSMKILDHNTPEYIPFGVSDEEAWSVGLSCGGKMEVFAEPFIAFSEKAEDQTIWQQLHHNLKNNKGCVLLTAINKGYSHHRLIDPQEIENNPDELSTLGLKAYQERKNQVFTVGEVVYFAQVFPRKSQLIIVGAAHITTDLVTLGNLYDFETIVIDPRGIFANKTQFPNPPDQLHVSWPQEILPNLTLDEYAYAVLLTHDPKIDDQALQVLLPSNIGYIGALGSKRTHAKRVNRLEKAGFAPEVITRIHGPIGVNINAKKPKEIALSIMGEIILTKNAHL